ncbi:hypothetical protein ES703_99656 [subsurface metagenome]
MKLPFTVATALPLTLSVAEVAPTMVPLTLSAGLLVTNPSDGEVMVISGLLGLTSIVLVPDVPVLPAMSTALTRTVLLPTLRVTLSAKLPPLSSVRAAGVPSLMVTVVVALTSSTLPETVKVVPLITSPSDGLPSVTTGATVSGSTVRRVMTALPPKIAPIVVVPADTVVARPLTSIVAVAGALLAQIASLVLSLVEPSE